MITKSDWQAALDELTAEDRAKLGMPPTAEQLVAFENGELSAEETERVRQFLVAYPELARAVAQPFPEEAEPLPDGEIDRRWTEFRGRIQTPPKLAPVLVFWRALAAGLAIVVAGLVWQQHRDHTRPLLIGEEQLLEPDGSRGPAGPTVTLSTRAEWALVTVPIIGSTGYDDYRLSIDSPGSNDPSWRSDILTRPDNDAFAIAVPKRFLSSPGTYRVVLSGVRGNSEETLATYSLRVPKS